MARFVRPTQDEIRDRRRALTQRARAGGLRFPEDIREIRMTFGRSQDEFAALVGLTRRQIADIENGKANPTYETIMKIGRLFGYRLAFVQQLDEDREPSQTPLADTHSDKPLQPETTSHLIAKTPKPDDDLEAALWNLYRGITDPGCRDYDNELNHARDLLLGRGYAVDDWERPTTPTDAKTAYG